MSINKSLLFIPLLGFALLQSCQKEKKIYKKWHKVTLTFDGPECNEQDEDNPFLNYRLNVVFNKEDRRFNVPGYFAADGNAAETSSDGGNKWRVHFRPDEIGSWHYTVYFKKGNNIAVADGNNGDSGGFMDGDTGTFEVVESDAEHPDFRSKGRLKYVNRHYLQFSETGEYFFKAGADAPENFLAYADFDGDFKSDGRKDDLIKTWTPHEQDWNRGDPTWQNGKGKGMIGALNYLSSKGMNAFSFIPLTVEGDDLNVYPYTSYEERLRMDVSKLDQWEIVFDHAQTRGLFLHFKTQEAENQGLLDNGDLGTERKLYYRELIARFGHHLALNWNLGEENGEWMDQHPTPAQNTEQRMAMAQYFYDRDPYRHHVVIHNGASFEDLLGTRPKITGASIQTNRQDFANVHKAVLEWRQRSTETGKRWVLTVDEPGDHRHSLLPDEEDPNHDNARKNALWGAFMAGAAGIEWYFGYEHPHSDLTCEDWRSRDKMWDQSRYCIDFFSKNNIPVNDLIPDDYLTDSSDDYCMLKSGELYLVYSRHGGICKFRSPNLQGKFRCSWYNPRTGKFEGTSTEHELSGHFSSPQPPSTPGDDWLMMLQKI